MPCAKKVLGFEPMMENKINIFLPLWCLIQGCIHCLEWIWINVVYYFYCKIILIIKLNFLHISLTTLRQTDRQTHTHTHTQLFDKRLDWLVQAVLLSYSWNSRKSLYRAYLVMCFEFSFWPLLTIKVITTEGFQSHRILHLKGTLQLTAVSHLQIILFE